LTSVLSAFPADLPATVFIVQHLDPRYPSHMVEILARRVSMRITEANDGALTSLGTIYLAPPAKHMLVEHRHIRLTSSELVHFVRPSVDLLLESVAAAFGPRVIGVILTGSGTDGAVGLDAVKQRGGFTIVQDPADAESTGMPSAAVATGNVDLVLPLDEIGPQIVSIVKGEISPDGDE
jgi:two-component system chemotaxis response regulator CheB